MRRLACVLFQLDEARRYIEDGRIEHLRLALLLLDNAAEIQMDRRIQEDWSNHQLRGKLRKRVLEIPQEHRSPALQELVEWTPLTHGEKTRLDRYFDEKVAYMTGRGGHVAVHLAGPLKHLHRYRNEAYHRANVRPETIRTAALVLLEINCELALAISPAARSIGSNEDYSWLQERFGWNPWHRFFDEEKLRGVIDEIRSGVLPDDRAVAATLAEHMENRLATLDGDLVFIMENLAGIPDREAALEESRRYAELRQAEDPQPRVTRLPPGSFTMRRIQEIEARISQVGSAATTVEAFDRFAVMEAELEPIERCVQDCAVQIDMAIQAEIDRLRGK